MDEREDKNVLHWLKGNYFRLSIPLQQVLFSGGGESADTTPYTPPTGSDISVRLCSNLRTYNYEPIQEGSVIYIRDNGDLCAGCYSIVITITEPSGRKRRSKWDAMVYIHDAMDEDIQYLNEFIIPPLNIHLSIFIFKIMTRS